MVDLATGTATFLFTILESSTRLREENPRTDTAQFEELQHRGAAMSIDDAVAIAQAALAKLGISLDGRR